MRLHPSHPPPHDPAADVCVLNHESIWFAGTAKAKEVVEGRISPISTSSVCQGVSEEKTQHVK